LGLLASSTSRRRFETVAQVVGQKGISRQLSVFAKRCAVAGNLYGHEAGWRVIICSKRVLEVHLNFQQAVGQEGHFPPRDFGFVILKARETAVLEAEPQILDQVNPIWFVQDQGVGGPKWHGSPEEQRAEFARVPYNMGPTAEKIVLAGMPATQAARLLMGK
jgi:hypothetical protein